MKKVNILCVGKIKEKYFCDAIAEYTKRLSRYCNLSIKELPDIAADNPKISIEAESTEILKKMSGYNILLDIKGQQLSSGELSQKLDKIYTLGADCVTFIIGGSNGVSDEVKKASDLLLSFGSMTLPHQLMRVVLIEQIYRAFNISANTPYHK